MAITSVDYQQLDLFKPFNPAQVNLTSPRFSFVDLFAGIGGFRIALEELGGKCLGYSEIDQEAVRVYQNNFLCPITTQEVNLGDASQLDKLPFPVDLLVGGVPCQPWSIAGKLGGFTDPRGTLWFDVVRIVQTNQPKAFIWENVKGLTEPRNQLSFNWIIHNLRTAGYVVKYQVLNSYDFGLPQDRDRIFIVGIRQDLANANNFTFPEPLGINPKLYDFIDGVAKYPIIKKKFNSEILFNGKIPASRGRFQRDNELNDFFLFADIRDGHTTIHSWDLIETTAREKLICQTILRNRRKKKYGYKDGNPLSFSILNALIPNLTLEEVQLLVTKNILRYISDRGYEFVNSKISSGINGISKIFLPHADVIGTLTATGTRDFIATVSLECQEPEIFKKRFIREIYQKQKFQPVTAKNYAKLQGFPDWFILADKESTAKKQFGNAISVPVVYHLAKSLIPLII